MSLPVDIVADLDQQSGTAMIPALVRFLYDLRERLPMFTVYDHPLDRPDVFVARLWTTLPEPNAVAFVLTAARLDTIRNALDALGLVHLSRNPEDDAKILETWL